MGKNGEAKVVLLLDSAQLPRTACSDRLAGQAAGSVLRLIDRAGDDGSNESFESAAPAVNMLAPAEGQSLADFIRSQVGTRVDVVICKASGYVTDEVREALGSAGLLVGKEGAPTTMLTPLPRWVDPKDGPVTKVSPAQLGVSPEQARRLAEAGASFYDGLNAPEAYDYDFAAAIRGVAMSRALAPVDNTEAEQVAWDRPEDDPQKAGEVNARFAQAIANMFPNKVREFGSDVRAFSPDFWKQAGSEIFGEISEALGRLADLVDDFSDPAVMDTYNNPNGSLWALFSHNVRNIFLILSGNLRYLRDEDSETYIPEGSADAVFNFAEQDKAALQKAIALCDDFRLIMVEAQGHEGAVVAVDPMSGERLIHRAMVTGEDMKA